MRSWIIRNFALSYESKVFGNIGRHPRAVNFTISWFAFAIIYHGLFEPLSVIEYVVWIPFVVCIYLGFFYFDRNPISYAEVEDWEQKYQFLNKPANAGNEDTTFPIGPKYQVELTKHTLLYNAKYKTEDEFVESNRIYYPFAVIILLILLAAFNIISF